MRRLQGKSYGHFGVAQPVQVVRSYADHWLLLESGNSERARLFWSTVLYITVDAMCPGIDGEQASEPLT